VGWQITKKGALDSQPEVISLPVACSWFSTSASSTTKTGCHDMAEILLKVALKHQNQIKSIYWILELFQQSSIFGFSFYYN